MGSPWSGRELSEGEWFGMERRWRSVSQSELARQTGVKQHYISQWELGAEMHPDMAKRLWGCVLEKEHRERGWRKIYSRAPHPDARAS